MEIPWKIFPLPNESHSWSSKGNVSTAPSCSISTDSRGYTGPEGHRRPRGLFILAFFLLSAILSPIEFLAGLGRLAVAGSPFEVLHGRSRESALFSYQTC